MLYYSFSRHYRAILMGLVLLTLSLFLVRNVSRLSSLTLSTVFTAPRNNVDWERFAYVQYVTNTAYLCNSVMIFESLKRLGSKAQRLMMYPETWNLSDDSYESQMLAKARDDYHAHLAPVQIQRSADQEFTWMDSFTKLLAFNQTQYDRVISLDSDATVLQSMDELFFLPPSPVAMPRAYWLDPEVHVLSSQLMVIQPSGSEFGRVMQQIQHHGQDEFDMEIVNNLYGESCIVIPHRPYDLLTGEFGKPDHRAYLGSTTELWDPERIVEEAKFLHFSDWPFPKPWINAGEESTDRHKPPCQKSENSGVEDDCRNQRMWMWFYEDFSRRRNEICGERYVNSLEKWESLLMGPHPPRE